MKRAHSKIENSLAGSDDYQVLSHIAQSYPQPSKAEEIAVEKRIVASRMRWRELLFKSLHMQTLALEKCQSVVSGAPSYRHMTLTLPSKSRTIDDDTKGKLIEDTIQIRSGILRSKIYSAWLMGIDPKQYLPSSESDIMRLAKGLSDDEKKEEYQRLVGVRDQAMGNLLRRKRTENDSQEVSDLAWEQREVTIDHLERWNIIQQHLEEFAKEELVPDALEMKRCWLQGDQQGLIQLELRHGLPYLATATQLGMSGLHQELSQVLLEFESLINERILQAMKLLLYTVYKVYNPNNSSGFSMIDVFSIAYQGAQKAAKRCRYRKGAGFSTLVVTSMRNNLSNASKKSNLVRFPVHIFELARKIQDLASQIQGEGAKPLTFDELKTRVNTTSRTLNTALHFMKSQLSLDKPLSDDETTTLGDVTLSTQSHVPNTEDLLDSVAYKKALFRALKSSIDGEAAERNYDILLMRFGLPPHEKPHTLVEVAKAHKISRERVRQIVDKILEKTKEALKYDPLFEGGK